MLDNQIIFDYNRMMASAIGDEQGISEGALEQLAANFGPIHDAIHNRTGKGSDFLGFLDLPDQPQEALERVQETADRLAAAGDKHVVLGIGGSYLGAKALINALCHPYHNELSRAARKGRPRMYFEGNNLDSDALSGLIDLLEQPSSVDNTWTLNVISKSGGTIETAAAFRILRKLAENHYGSNAAQHIVATTDASKGQLRKLADAEGYTTFVIPDDVGGRYSVLTPVGLLPAAIAGVDIFEVVRGAKDMAALCRNPNFIDNPAYLYAGLQFLSLKAGKGVSVMNIWDKALEFVGFWYDQLCAESVGKDGMGRVPLTGVCTRDLHSRGQELQDGPRNTVITNLLVRQSDRTLTLPADPGDSDSLNYLGEMSVHHMLQGAFDGTNFAYAQDQRPTMSFILQQRSAYTIGALFYLLEVATVAEGYLMGVNPLDQPGVEAYKKFMFGLLGRADMAAYRAEFDQRTPDRPQYQR
jgi:glucose-6-phosphate isomerase